MNTIIIVVILIIFASSLFVSNEAFATLPNLSNVTYVNSLSVNSEDKWVRGLALTPNGEKLFMTGDFHDKIYEYSLNTPFDLSDVTYNGYFSVRSVDDIPQDVTFSPNGEKMFVVVVRDPAILEYSLTVPFDLSSVVTYVISFPIDEHQISPRGVEFSSDGTKMFVVDGEDSTVHQYTLNTPFDLSDVVTYVISFPVGSPTDNSIDGATAMAFSTDGKKMFIVDDRNDTVYEYSLTTPFDLSNAYFVDSFSVVVHDNSSRGIALSSDGTKMFLSGSLHDFIYEYILSDILGGGDGNSYDNYQKPTLGVDNNGRRLVDNGFSYNGNSIDVEYFYTEYPVVTVNVGEPNIAQFKIYDNDGYDNVSHFELAFGLDDGESINYSRVVINWDKSWDGIETVTVHDSDNMLQNVTVTSSVGVCQDYFSQECLILDIYHTFREAPEFNILATNVWDYKRNAWQNYFNHGIEVVGESLNPPNMYNGINKGHIYHLTETSKGIAVDEFDNSWSFQYGKWEMDYIPNKKPIDGITMHGYTRTNSNFEMYKFGQYLIAETKLVTICPHCLDEPFDKIYDIFAYEYSTPINSLDNSEIQLIMEIESQRAQKIMNNLLDPLYYLR